MKTYKRYLVLNSIIFILLLLAGCSNGSSVSSDNLISSETVEKQQETTEIPTEELTSEMTTSQVDTTNPTEATQSRENIIQSGYWCCYNKESNSLNIYTFEDEIISEDLKMGHYILYFVRDNTVVMDDSVDNNSIINYKVTDNDVTVIGEGGFESHFYFTDDENILSEEVNGNKRKYVRMDAVPNYNTIKKYFG